MGEAADKLDPPMTTPTEAERVAMGLRPMQDAPKDGSYILAIYKPREGSVGYHWDGRAFVICHAGITRSDFDLGWNLFPGFGGIADEWFYGWSPIPVSLDPAALSQEDV